MKIKYQKIRGIKRKIKHVQSWIEENKVLRKDHLEEYKYVNSDIVIHPWCDISLGGSRFPEPEGKIKGMILKGLVDIYYSWKEELDKIGKPYYLKIWLFDPRFSQSQVVCAIDDNISFYDDNFFMPTPKNPINTTKFGILKEKLDKFSWIHAIDEDHLDDYFFSGPAERWISKKAFEESMKFFLKEKKKKHRKIELEEGKFDYIFPSGDIWIGELKK